ncbi:hypothetical protein PG993_000714 [Apiospora rasikravindrae]|uniref:Serine/threonine-protein kinase ppk6 n=1 Tax=Apiospora rasikravindrae TaxID=990691 RepID=A0ABR1U9B9_9PEZI
MSADLFAEFADFEAPPASQTPQPAKPSSDPFDLSSLGNNRQTSSAPPPQQQNQPWPAFQPTPDPWAIPATTASTAPIPQGTNTIGNDDDDDDDDEGWGDFEVAENTKPALSNVPPPLPAAEVAKPYHDIPARTRIVRAPTIDLLSNSLISVPGGSSQAGKTSLAQSPKPKLETISQKSTRKPHKPDPNVLFDADDFAGDNPDDDEFGDFETVAPPASSQAATNSVRPKKPASQMLASLSLQEPAPKYPQAPKSPSFQQRNPFPGLALRTPAPSVSASKDDPKSSPITAWPTLDNMDSAGSNKMDDGWGDWDSFDSRKPASKKPVPKKPASSKKPISKKPEKASTLSQITDASWDWDAADQTVDEPRDDGNQVPPSNVPPPSVLLSIFPQLLGMANKSLYKPVSGQPFSTKNRIMSDPRTLEFLKGYISLATVAARIIAGRKQRWHRDKFLAQSMSISAAGSKGMKLAGIDKTQSAREDREASDVLDVWKEHVGRLRSALAAANSAVKDQQLRIPELRENMPVQTAKGVPTSTKACIICGLRRDERVARVDFEVEDSFGEWWAEHWGHLACKRFWLKHENALRQR